RRTELPQSRTRKGADAKRKAAQARKTAERQAANEERRAASAPTAAERRRARRAERAAATASETTTSDGKQSGAAKSDGKQSDTKKSGSASGTEGRRRRTTAERRGVANKRTGEEVRRGPASRRWVPPTFITAFLLGVLWLIVFYVAGNMIPVMSDLGNWNILVGMGLMAVSFIIATLWK